MMMVFGNAAGGFRGGRQVFPVDYELEVSQRLLEAVHGGDMKAAFELLADPCLDVNYAGAVCLKSRKAEVVLRGEAPAEVRFEYEEFRTDVTPLFLAAHSGNMALARKLLNMGADVNQKLFKGFATTAAVREGHLEMIELLLKAGASQEACEEALLEASWHGWAHMAELLMHSDLIRHNIAVHALVTASCRGFLEVVESLVKCGVDANAADRVLLCSSKPTLHTNVDCNALVAAIVTRQVTVVRHLLQAGVRTDTKVSLGAWSWDLAAGDELRVGAGLSEPYGVAWCAVEYFESTGTILRLLLLHHPPNAPHFGRALLHHAILCANDAAVSVLLDSGADFELPVKTSHKNNFGPIHMAARLGLARILQSLVNTGCDLNSRTDSGDTALMVCARYKQDECLCVLASVGADFGAVNSVGQSVLSISNTNRWAVGFQQAVVQTVRSGKMIQSSNLSVFSSLLFITKSGDIEALKALLELPGINLDEQDEKGFSALMVAALEEHAESFRLLVFAGADAKLCNKCGETAIGLAALSRKRDQFEKVMLEFELEKGNHGPGGFYALHCAARRGDLDALRLLTSRGYDVNVIDEDGYTPLMLAAREGHASLCQFLISCGGRCDIKTTQGETALLLARKNGSGAAEGVILDQLARVLVLGGALVRKHTKEGRGRPHGKVMRMVAGAGLLRWGKSSRRNVVCREVEVGPSSSFQRNRGRKGDARNPGVFRVVTTKGREVHFVCEGGEEAAELWVRGIRLVTGEAFGRDSKNIE